MTLTKWEDWIISGGPMPGFDLPEVPLPDTITLCRDCGEILEDPDAEACYICKRVEDAGTLAQMAEDRFRDQ